MTDTYKATGFEAPHPYTVAPKASHHHNFTSDSVWLESLLCRIFGIFVGRNLSRTKSATAVALLKKKVLSVKKEKHHSSSRLFSDVIDYSPCHSKTLQPQAMHDVWETQISRSVEARRECGGGAGAFWCWEHFRDRHNWASNLGKELGHMQL